MKYKTVNGLMKHLRKKGIKIKRSNQKRQLINNGCFHGYKGYRYFKYPNIRINYNSYNDINSTIEFDMKLKTLIYPKIMFIETAMKSIVTETLIEHDKSETITVMLNKAVLSYKNYPSYSTKADRNKYQKDKLELESRIRNIIRLNYNNNSIKHYYQSSRYTDVPIWSLINIMTLGDLGHLIECLTFDVRDKISNHLKISNHFDQQRQFVFHFIFLLKDLRNAIAHNSVIIDARFKSFNVRPCITNTLKNELNLNYINFDSIDDYIITIVFILKNLGINKQELLNFANDYLELVKWYHSCVDTLVSSIVIKKDLILRIKYLIAYINK